MREANAGSDGRRAMLPPETMAGGTQITGKGLGKGRAFVKTFRFPTLPDGLFPLPWHFGPPEAEKELIFNLR